MSPSSQYLKLQSHPYVKHLGSSTSKFNPISYLLHDNSNHNEDLFTGGTLSGSHLISKYPILFSKYENCKNFNREAFLKRNEISNELIGFFHLGQKLSGQVNIVHGGLLATLLDENLYRCCVPFIENKIGVTANLNLNYKNPTYTNSFIVLHAKLLRIEDERKFFCYGKIESLKFNEKEEGNEKEKGDKEILDHYLNKNNIDDDIKHNLNKTKNPKKELLVEANILVMKPKWV
ncbi:PaaI family thioesterase ASCRUDRAFT_74413 [Ascoidea rubescens DSM 1968]|uniref:Thioesterase domain-containing protein n=1 Tax=Ascoidea rubescens DSM 1968 TaxID=1344418 RepID=A0A1D2VMZ1_9ASCO|nr:hypothetical protein ASCRUDRAFT_74413 [Ascoidea rubescens DSM 1968]ODV62982.1 hypothetical protein ASCRUDRAFT_74413 [Ascoidea rubescens DSM 1968]